MKILLYLKSLGHTVQGPSLQMQNWVEVTCLINITEKNKQNLKSHWLSWQTWDHPPDLFPLTSVLIPLSTATALTLGFLRKCLHWWPVEGNRSCCVTRALTTSLLPSRTRCEQPHQRSVRETQDHTLWAWGTRPPLGCWGASFNCIPLKGGTEPLRVPWGSMRIKGHAERFVNGSNMFSHMPSQKITSQLHFYKGVCSCNPAQQQGFSSLASGHICSWAKCSLVRNQEGTSIPNQKTHWVPLRVTRSGYKRNERAACDSV